MRKRTGFLILVALGIAGPLSAMPPQRSHPQPHPVCGPRTEEVTVVICGQKAETPVPTETATGRIKDEASKRAPCVCSESETCPSQKKCKINHVVLPQTPPRCKFEDVPEGVCTGQTAAWVCRQWVTFDCMCQ